MKTSDVIAVLRKDVSYVCQGIVAAVLIGFVGLALVAAALDILAIRN